MSGSEPQLPWGCCKRGRRGRQELSAWPRPRFFAFFFFSYWVAVTAFACICSRHMKRTTAASETMRVGPTKTLLVVTSASHLPPCLGHLCHCATGKAVQSAARTPQCVHAAGPPAFPTNKVSLQPACLPLPAHHDSPRNKAQSSISPYLGTPSCPYSTTPPRHLAFHISLSLLPCVALCLDFFFRAIRARQGSFTHTHPGPSYTLSQPFASASDRPSLRPRALSRGTSNQPLPLVFP